MFKSIMKFRLFTQFISAGSSPGIRHSFGGIYRVLAAKVEDDCHTELLEAVLYPFQEPALVHLIQPRTQKDIDGIWEILALCPVHRSSIFPPRINTTSIW